MDERILNLLRRLRECEAAQEELVREMRVISQELVERRFEARHKEVWGE